MRHRLLVTAAILVVDVSQAAAGENIRFTPFLGCRPPEIESKGEHWINTADQLTLEKLRGRPVWLQVNF